MKRKISIVLMAVMIMSLCAVAVNAATFSNHGTSIATITMAKAKVCKHKKTKITYKSYNSSAHWKYTRCKNCNKILKSSTEAHKFGKKTTVYWKDRKGNQYYEDTWKCTKCGCIKKHKGVVKG